VDFRIPHLRIISSLLEVGRGFHTNLGILRFGDPNPLLTQPLNQITVMEVVAKNICTTIFSMNMCDIITILMGMDGMTVATVEVLAA
jgi:hypothetical protein